MSAPKLVYNETPIHDRGEMLCLTDMWRAAGSDTAKAPYEWRRLPGSGEFIDHVGAITGKSRDELFQVSRGGSDPATWAHWQIAFAYAKYLSPEFHAWCNDVVRAHMEGRRYGNSAPVSQDLLAILAPLQEMVERAIAPIREDVGKIVTFIGNKRLNVPMDVERDVYGCCLRFYRGLCANCSEVQVVDDAGNKIKPGQLEHWGGRHDPRRENLWITCEACNRRLETEIGYRASRHPKFYAFQLDLKRYCADVRAPQQQASLLLPLPGLSEPPPVPPPLPGEFTRAECICSAIWFTYGNDASLAEIGACGIATDGKDGLASVRNGILRQLEGSTEHSKPPWNAKPTLFQLADPTMKGKPGVRYSCTAIGIETAKRVGPLLRSAG